MRPTHYVAIFPISDFCMCRCQSRHFVLRSFARMQKKQFLKNSHQLSIYQLLAASYTTDFKSHGSHDVFTTPVRLKIFSLFFILCVSSCRFLKSLLRSEECRRRLSRKFAQNGVGLPVFVFSEFRQIFPKIIKIFQLVWRFIPIFLTQGVQRLRWFILP